LKRIKIKLEIAISKPKKRNNDYFNAGRLKGYCLSSIKEGVRWYYMKAFSNNGKGNIVRKN